MNKYRNTKCTDSQGRKYDSKTEMRRYLELEMMERAEQIFSLERQVRFPLMVGAVKIGDYVADAVYWQDGRRIIEDVKGVRTAVFMLKSKHMAAQGDPVTCWPPREKKRKKDT